MTGLAIAAIFTGAVIFVWGLRAIRNRRVKVVYFKLRSWMSTMIFGIVAMLCGLLLMIAGPAATSSATAELADIMAKVALYVFAAGWVISLVLEGLARVGARLFPQETPQQSPEKRDATNRSGQKPKHTALILLLVSASQLYNRIMTALRSWNKQHPGHAAQDYEKQKSDK